MLVHMTDHSNVTTFFSTWLSMTRSEGSYVVEEVFYATGKRPLAFMKPRWLYIVVFSHVC